MLFDRRALARFGLMQRGNVPSPARERAENTFGQSYDDVVLHRRAVPGDSEALGAAKGREVYLNPSLETGGFIEDVVLAHELAHVSQQSTPGPADGGASLEHDADAGARLSCSVGRPVPVPEICSCLGASSPGRWADHAFAFPVSRVDTDSTGRR